MYDKELRKIIGSRTRARRKELKLTQDYLAEKLDVNKSTIQRYESGSIDNTKRLVVQGLADALHVSADWLTGKTDEFYSEVPNRLRFDIRNVIESIEKSFSPDLDDTANEFSQSLFLLILQEYILFNESFANANRLYLKSKEYEDLAEQIGFGSTDEFNEVMFLREIMHTSNLFLELSNLLKDYPQDPQNALSRLKELLTYYQ